MLITRTQTRFLWAILMPIVLQGCDLFGNHSPEFPAPASCSDADYNQYVYDVMKRFYFWYDKVDPANSIEPSDTITYPTPNDLLSALRYNPPDHFSSIGDATSFNQFYGEGQFLGVGLRLLTDTVSGDLMVAYAFDNSPAATAGIQRGDQIIEINDFIANGLTGQDWDTAWGADEAGVNVKLRIRHSDSTEEIVNIQKAIVTINTTQHSTVINTGSHKVGYLHFTNFLNLKSIAELSSQFSNFQSNQVNELIVDLRYNGGGSVQTAQYLGSLIGGSNTEGSIFTRLVFNNKSNGYDGHKETYWFQSAAEALNLNRVFFITSNASCSASELVINSLLPFQTIDVIVIGSTTCGKPAGSKPDSQCGKVFAPISFEIRNAANNGGYYNGIGPGYSGLTDFCEAVDNINLPLADSSENSVASALDYIQNGQCNSSFNTKQNKYRKPSTEQRNTQAYSVTEGLY